MTFRFQLSFIAFRCFWLLRWAACSPISAVLTPATVAPTEWDPDTAEAEATEWDPDTAEATEWDPDTAEAEATERDLDTAEAAPTEQDPYTVEATDQDPDTAEATERDPDTTEATERDPDPDTAEATERDLATVEATATSFRTIYKEPPRATTSYIDSVFIPAILVGHAVRTLALSLRSLFVPLVI